jgi:tetratricopeptide (TPR) repeat protein
MKHILVIVSSLWLFSCTENNSKTTITDLSEVILTSSQVDSLKKVLNNLDSSSFRNKSEFIYDLIVKNDPLDKESILNLAIIKRVNKKYDETLALIDKLDMNDPIQKEFAYESKMIVYMTKGITDSLNYYSKKYFDFDSNIKHIEYAVAFYEEQNRPEFGLELLDYAIEKMPVEYKLYLIRGLLYQELSEFQKNKDDYNQKSLNDLSFAEKGIKNYEVYGARGWTYLLLKNYNKAISDFNKALKDESYKHYYNDREYMIPHIYKGRGIAKAKLKKYQEGLLDLKKSSEMGDTIAARLYKEVESEMTGS